MSILAFNIVLNSHNSMTTRCFVNDISPITLRSTERCCSARVSSHHIPKAKSDLERFLFFLINLPLCLLLSCIVLSQRRNPSRQQLPDCGPAGCEGDYIAATLTGQRAPNTLLLAGVLENDLHLSAAEEADSRLAR